MELDDAEYLCGVHRLHKGVCQLRIRYIQVPLCCNLIPFSLKQNIR